MSLAQSLHINVQGVSKAQLVKLIRGQATSVTSETKVDTEPETDDVFEDTASTVQDTVPPPQQVTAPTQEQLKHQFEYNILSYHTVSFVL